MSYMDCSDWDKCTKCGDCLTKCPIMDMDKGEAAMAIGLLIEGKPVGRVLSECTLCFNCNSYCPEGLRPLELITQRMTESRKKPVTAFLPYFMNGHMAGPNFFQDMYQGLNREENSILDRWAEPPEKCDEVLWVGCIGRMSCVDLDKSRALASLPKFGPRGLCCGEIHYRAGSWDAYIARMESTFAQLSSLKTKRMVCYCASCYMFLTRILPDVYGKSLPFEMISLYQWLWEKVESGELEFTQPLRGSAAISESCYVSELEDGFAASLRKLYAAAGLTVKELPHHGANNLSCGAICAARDQNIIRSTFKTQRAKYRDVKKSGTNTMALNCPGCFLTMSTTSRLFGIRLKYMPDMLLRALGDTVSRPLNSRMPAIIKTLARRAPLAFKKVDPRLMPEERTKR